MVERVPPVAWLLIGALVVVLATRWVRNGITRRRADTGERWHRRSLPGTLVGLALAAAVTGWMTTALDQPILVSWLLAVNAVAVVYYGWDKLAAQLAVARVPEATLHLLALAGGSVGALVGQRAFRHKTSKRGFQATLWIVVALQVALVAVYVRGRSTPI